MKARAVTALALVFVAPWLAANERTISRIANPKARQTQRAVFARTVAELHARQHHAPVRSAANARALAQRILADRARFAFGEVQKPAPKTWLQLLEEWLGRRWRAIIDALFGKAHLSRGATVAIGDVLLGLSLVAFFGLLARLLLQYGRRSVQPGAQSYSLDSRESAASLAARAQQSARAGEYNRAATLLFSASLHVLTDRGVLESDSTRTVGELRRRVRVVAPAVAQSFEILGTVLTKAVYAGAAVTPGDWEAALGAYERLKQLPGRTHAA